MDKVESLTGHEVCSSPEELASLFNQWKLSPEGQFAEEKIVSTILDVPTTSHNLIEPFRDLTFGFYLAQQVFPNSGKYPYPALRIDQSDEVSAAVRTSITYGPRCVVAGEPWLQKHLSDKHPSTHLIDIGVEEFSHWVFEQAIKQRRNQVYRASLQFYYELTKDDVKRPLEEVVVKINEIDSLNLLKYTYFFLTGKIRQQLAKNEQLLSESESAILKHSSTFQEHMGIVWRNQVSQRYYPWSEEAGAAKKQLENVIAYKRQKAAERRQTGPDLLR